MSVSVCPLPGAASGMSGASGKRQETAALVQRRPGLVSDMATKGKQEGVSNTRLMKRTYAMRTFCLGIQILCNWLKSFLKDLYQDLKKEIFVLLEKGW